MSRTSNKFLTLLIIVTVTATATMVFAQNATPDDYECINKVGGEWNYGRAPMACDANAFGSDSMVFSYLPTVVFYDNLIRDAERSRYMDEVYALARDAAARYAKKRNPKISDDELQNWSLLVLATSSHESYWSHYRVAAEDNRLKMMRGDFGHGHGLMQVDDRWHFPAVQQGIAWNMVLNLTYGMDELYEQWERAPKQTCVKKADNYEARIRSTWSAYNGGPSKICRWANPKDKWAHNDKNFYNHLLNKRWMNYIRNPAHTPSIDVPCMMEKKENCAKPTPPQLYPNLKAGTLYRFPGDKFCVWDEMQLQCVEEYRDAVCLNAFGSIVGDPVTITTPSEYYKHLIVDRHAICPKFVNGLFNVGENVQLQMAINQRTTPGGGLVGQIPPKTIIQVLDFEIRGKDSKDRYYKVTFNSKDGWIYAGTAVTAKDWVTTAPPQPNWPSTVARIGDSVKIVAPNGINLRVVPDGQLIGRLPKNQIYRVEEVNVTGSNNAVYYKVSSPMGVGFIYSGQLLPTSTVEQWAVRIR